MSERTGELRRLMVRTARSESQMLGWLAEFEDRVRAEAAPAPLTEMPLRRQADPYGGQQSEDYAEGWNDALEEFSDTWVTHPSTDLASAAAPRDEGETT